jgi:hypothetical protein
MRPTPFRARESVDSVDSEWGCVVSLSTRAGGGAASHRFRIPLVVMKRQRRSEPPASGCNSCWLAVPQWQYFSARTFERGLVSN